MNISVSFVLVATLSLSACASTNTRTEPTIVAAGSPATTPPGGRMADMCPMDVPGTTVAALSIEGGAALAFTTTGNIAELRQRVRRMSDMENQMHQRGEVGLLVSTSGRVLDVVVVPDPRTSPLPQATAAVDDIANGARLVLQPTNPAQLTELREHTVLQAAKMGRGSCPLIVPDGVRTTTPAAQ